MEQPKMIKSFDELKDLASHTHYIEVAEIGNEGVSAWVRSKDRENESDLYLSTHSFFDSHRKSSTQLLQERGFNVQLTGEDKVAAEEEMAIGVKKINDTSNVQFDALKEFVEKHGMTQHVQNVMHSQIHVYAKMANEHGVSVDRILPGSLKARF